MNRTALILLFGTAVACGDSTTAPSHVIGRYALVSVNAVSLPAQIVKADTTIVFVADTLNVNADGTYSNHQWTRITIDNIPMEDSSVSIGNYTNNGPTYTFTDAGDQSTVVGTFANGHGIVSGNGTTVLGQVLTLEYIHL